jgi:hypothetical protein
MESCDERRGWPLAVDEQNVAPTIEVEAGHHVETGLERFALAGLQRFHEPGYRGFAERFRLFGCHIAPSSASKSRDGEAHRGRSGASNQAPGGLEAVAVLFGQNEVVKQVNSQHTAGLSDAFRQPNVFVASLAIAGYRQDS